MKTTFTSILLFLALTFGAFAQLENVQVDITKLSQQELMVYQQLKQKQSAAATFDNLSPEKIDKYAQMGKGIGVAINEGLGAVTKNVEQFSQTSAGKWLMVIITWKVMGQDAIGLTRTVVQYTIGASLLVVGIPFWIWIVRRNCVNSPIASIEKTGFWSKKITYKSLDPIHDEWTVAYGAAFLVYIGIVALITFVH